MRYDIRSGWAGQPVERAPVLLLASDEGSCSTGARVPDPGGRPIR